jgi:Phytanoyl-CoA dioxygenase (PhyH)
MRASLGRRKHPLMLENAAGMRQHQPMSQVLTDDAAALARIESLGFYAELLAEAKRAPVLDTARNARTNAGAHERVQVANLLGRQGYATWPLLAAAETAVLRALCTGLRDAGLPETCVYLFDEAWAPAQHLVAQLAPSSDGAYAVVRDGFAFWIAETQRGWRPHRGVYQECRDAAGNAKVLNVWLPLVDVNSSNACLYGVPLPDDPHYPHALDRVDYAAGSAIAMPAQAGEALLWNANLLHWGGVAALGAPPRINVTYTFAATSSKTAREFGLDIPVRAGLAADFRARLDFVAEQLVRYQAHHAPTPRILQWALMTDGLRQLRRR